MNNAFLKNSFSAISTILTCALLFTVSETASLHAANAAPPTPTITITKSDKLNVAITPLAGSGSGLATKVLTHDLNLSGYFSIVPAGGANFIVSGDLASGLRGKVTDHGGKIVLSQSFSGSPRSEAHRFADAIVQTLTGHPGIASGKIAFVSNRSGHKEIYTADSDGSNVVQLTHDRNISVGPKISDNGSRLLYTGYLDGYADVYEINLANGQRTHLIKYPGTNSGAVFSPNGHRIAVTLSKDGNPELYIIAGGAHRLTHTSGIEASPTWSPSGNEIIYTYDGSGGPQLYRISANGGRPQHIATGQGYCTEPDWSPDGKKVAYTVRSGGEFHIAVTTLPSGPTHILANGENPAWGADSRHLIYVHGGDLYLLDVPTEHKTKLLDGLGQISEPSWSR